MAISLACRRERDRSEQAKPISAVRPWPGVVDDEHQASVAVTAKLLAVEMQLTDLRVRERHGSSATRGDIVAGPEPAEEGTGKAVLADELDEARVVDVGPDRLAKACHECSGSPFLVGDNAVARGLAVSTSR